MESYFSPDLQAGINHLTERLTKELEADKRVLWLVPGGSNIKAVVKIMDALPEELTGKLEITLTDERFGPVGHLDSNLEQLYQAGFKSKSATVAPVLVEDLSLEETTERYARLTSASIEKADIVVALFGIGADGHIAGILPHSPATTAEGITAAYDSPPYQRITLSFAALGYIYLAYAFAFGEEKKPALTRLVTQNVPLEEQPSQILKKLPEAYLFTDQIQEGV